MTQAVTFSSPLGLTVLGTTQLGVPCSLERGNSSELLPGKSSNSSGCTEISLQHSPTAPDNTPTPTLWWGHLSGMTSSMCFMSPVGGSLTWLFKFKVLGHSTQAPCSLAFSARPLFFTGHSWKANLINQLSKEASTEEWPSTLNSLRLEGTYNCSHLSLYLKIPF